MVLVLISRFPLLVLFRNLLYELFHCNYSQIDARLRRLLRGKKPENMVWSDAARQFLRILYSLERNAGSQLTIPIPATFGREEGSLTHLQGGDRLSAAEMLGEVLAPWNQYKFAFIDLLTAFMLERKILIVSSDMQCGSVLCVSLRALISPFIWRHVFQPSMPPSLVGEVPMIQAPFPFLMHTSSHVQMKECEGTGVVVCTFKDDTLTVVNEAKDALPPKLLHSLRSTESAVQLIQVVGEAVSELYNALLEWRQAETTQPMANPKAFLKKRKLPSFRSANDEFLLNFFQTQLCCDVVDEVLARKLKD